MPCRANIPYRFGYCKVCQFAVFSKRFFFIYTVLEGIAILEHAQPKNILSETDFCVVKACFDQSVYLKGPLTAGSSPCKNRQNNVYLPYPLILYGQILNSIQIIPNVPFPNTTFKGSRSVTDGMVYPSLV